MTRAGSVAADLSSTGVFVAWLIGIAILAPPDVSVLAGLVLFFGVLASWAVTYLAVGVGVDVFVMWRRARGR